MSFQSMYELASDPTFMMRNRACCVQQSQQAGVGDANPQAKALANGVLKDDGPYISVFVQLCAAFPGNAEKVETPSGVDQSLITDADLTAQTQANWPTVAALYFDDTGAPIT